MIKIEKKNIHKIILVNGENEKLLEYYARNTNVFKKVSKDGV